MEIKLYAPYNYDTDKLSEETALTDFEPTLTQQHMKEETDINVIVERFGVTGQLPLVPKQELVGDFSEVGDFHQCLTAIQQAEDAFMQLPAKTRDEFGNDAQLLVDALLSGDMTQEDLVRLGLTNGRNNNDATNGQGNGNASGPGNGSGPGVPPVTDGPQE